MFSYFSLNIVQVFSNMNKKVQFFLFSCAIKIDKNAEYLMIYRKPILLAKRMFL